MVYHQSSASKVRLFFAFLLMGALFASCGKHRKNIVAKLYHKTTSFFNGYYNANELMKETASLIDDAYVFPDEGLIEVIYYGTDDEAKGYESDFDAIIEKNDLVIYKHPNGGFVDDARLLNGISHFYKRNYSAALTNFKYLIEKFPESKLIPEARLWIAKTYYYSGQPEVAVDLVQRHIMAYDTVRFKKRARGDAALFIARLAADSGDYSQASAILAEQVKRVRRRHNRAEAYFQLAQLYSKQDEYPEALQYFSKVEKLSKKYDLAFDAKMKIARLYTHYQKGKDDDQLVYRYLAKLLKDPKNEEFYDRVYFELAMLELKKDSLDKAVAYFQKVIEAPQGKERLKALAYYEIGKMFFEVHQQYDSAQVYFDQAANTITKTAPEYREITDIAETLRKYVEYKTTIHFQDSMLWLAGLSEKERDGVINKVIAEKKKRLAEEKQREAARRREEQRKLQAQRANQYGGGNRASNWQQQRSNRGRRQGNFYFENPAAVSQGVIQFEQKWGKRKNEDNWRRMHKAAVFAANNPNSNEEGGENTEGDETQQPPAVDSTLLKKYGDKYEYYSQIPLTDTAVTLVNKEIETAIYKLAQIYDVKLQEPDSAIKWYEYLLDRYYETQYELPTRYALNRLYVASENPLQHVHYNTVVSEHPKTVYAYLLQGKDPKELKRTEDDFVYAYTGLFGAYRDRMYETAVGFSEFLMEQFAEHPELDMADLQYIRGMSYGYLGEKDSLRSILTSLIHDYPQSDVAPPARMTLSYLTGGKMPAGTGEASPPPLMNRTPRPAAPKPPTNEQLSDPNYTEYKDFIGEPADKDRIYVLLYLDKNNITKDEASTLISDFNRANKYKDKKSFPFMYKGTHLMPYITNFASIEEAQSYIAAFMNAPLAKKMLLTEKDRILYITHSNFRIAYGRKRMHDYLNYYDYILNQ